jgi:Protein of unknown function (DUF3105)
MWRPAGLPRTPRPWIAATALALAAWAAGGCAAGPRPAPVAVAPVAAPIEVVYPDQGHDHIPLPAFPHAPYIGYPPASGPHTPYTAPWGVHAKPIPDEILVHNLEHGGVVLGYRCTDCPDVAAELTRLAAGFPLVIVAPNPRLPAPIVLSAWQHTLRVPALDDEGRWAIRSFLARYHGIDHHLRAPAHAPPPGARAPGP